MLTKLRLAALVLTLAYSLVLSPGSALAARGPFLLPPWVRAPPERVRSALRPPLGVRVVRFARRLVGVPYVWGGDSPATGFDCSGLVRFVYAHFGLRLPHSSYSDYSLGVNVPRRALRPGDLVFFDGLGHVGIYVGHDRFIQAPHSGSDVQITSLAVPWYAGAYDGARRLVGVAGQILGQL